MMNFPFDDLTLTLIGGSFDNSSSTFTFAQIKSDVDQPALNEFGAATLAFCRDWLSNTQSFDLTTSGSTGSPKQITLQRSAMDASARATAKAIGLQPNDTALVCLDTRFIAGKMMLVRSLVIGMNVIVVEPTANPFSLLPENVRIDFTALVPYQASAIISVAADLKEFNRLSAVLIGGAAIEPSLWQLLQLCHPAIYATYGMTETISHIALQKINPPDGQDFFQSLPGVTLEADHRSCLVISADYLGDEKIVTNDVVELLSTDRFRWIGRWDNVINSGGIKVFPEKVEKSVAAIFESFEISNRFFVMGLEDGRFGSVVALIIEGAVATVTEAEIRDALSKTLTKFEIPKSVLYVEKFIETTSGKIQRKLTAKVARMR